METFTVGGKTVTLFPASQPGAPIFYFNTFDREVEEVFAALQGEGCPPFTLVAVTGLDWNREMVPWDSPAIFRKGEPFAGGADPYLAQLTGEILPLAEQCLPAPPAWRGLVGYSLAGLFSLYALTRTSLFSRAGSISGSLWFPGIREYLFAHPFPVRPQALYFSLGDREAKTRNPLLRQVEENTREIYDFYQSRGIDTLFQLNPGNHYNQPAQRTAAGIRWLLER